MICCLAVAIGGCSLSPDVSPKDLRAAEAFVRKEQQPLFVRPVALWYASDEPSFLLCGEIEAPSMLRPQQSTLRYVYDRDRGYGVVEPHEMLLTRSVVMQSLIDANRRLFDSTWQESCRPHAPVSRRIASWLPNWAQPSSPLSDEDRQKAALGEHRASQARLKALREMIR